jgi:hypothetical protein
MARSENQGLQIALIVLVIFSVLMTVLTYFFWSRSSHLTREVAALKEDATKLNAEKGKAVLEAEQLKAWIGYTPETSVDQIKPDYEKDMLTYAGGLPHVDQTYRKLPQHLMTALQERHQRITELSDEVRRLNEELAETTKRLEGELKLAKEAQAKSEADLRQVNDTFGKDRDRVETGQSQLTKRLDELRKKHTELVAQKDSEIEKLRRENAALKTIKEQREQEIQKLTKTNLDTPDGMVTWVNPKTSTVFINLGAEDGLRPQVTFSVFGVDVNNLAKESPKGSIEVTRVINGHMSEARIIDDSVEDPILTRDAIYSPVWDANSAMTFALLGMMDLDQDGRDDREIVKNLITINNGSIDAEDVNGEIVGKITSNTRYLVDGEGSSDTDDERSAATRKVRTEMLNQASLHGVEVIQLDEIIKYMGYTGEKRIVPLGKRARSDDFRQRPAGNGVNGSSNPAAYRQRFSTGAR